MDWTDHRDVPYGIPTDPLPTGGGSGSSNLDENSLLDNYTSLNCPDGPTLAGFVGGPGICPSYAIDPEGAGITIDPTGPGLDGGYSGHSFYEHSHPSASDILFTKNIPSKMKESDLLRIRDSYGIPASVQLRLPRPYERVSWSVPGWTFFYELPFKDGFRFPIPHMVGMVLEYFDIAPSQLMPNSWRLLLALQVLTGQHDISFGMPEILHCYFIREHDGEKGRFSLNARKNTERLITGLSLGDKGWKGSYFLASGDLVQQGNYRFPSAWSRGKLRISLTLDMLY